MDPGGWKGDTGHRNPPVGEWAHGNGSQKNLKHDEYTVAQKKAPDSDILKPLSPCVREKLFFDTDNGRTGMEAKKIHYGNTIAEKKVICIHVFTYNSFVLCSVVRGKSFFLQIYAIS